MEEDKSSRKPTLENLPAELFDEILQRSDQATVTALLLTSSILNSRVRPKLYAKISINNTPSQTITNLINTNKNADRKLTLLVRTLRSSPSLAVLVQSLHFNLQKFEFNPYLWKRITSILIHASQLKVLDLELTPSIRRSRPNHYQNSQWCFLPNDAATLCELRELRYIVSEDNTSVIKRAMSLPKLEKLEVPRIYKYQYWHLDGSSDTKSLRGEHVKEISIGSTVLCPALGDMLKWPVALEKFSCSFGHYWRSQLIPRYEDLTLQAVLDQQVMTLKELKIGRSFDLDIPREALDLSKFERLERLEVMSELIYPFGCEITQRAKVYKRLPPSLKSLKITFGPISHPKILSRIYQVDEHFQIDADYNWLQEIAVRSPQMFPCLKEVVLLEHSIYYHQYEFKKAKFQSKDVSEWKLPSDLENAFRKRNISLRVFLRTQLTQRNSGLGSHLRNARPC